MSVSGNGTTHFDNKNSGSYLENFGRFTFTSSNSSTDILDIPFLNHGSATFTGGVCAFDNQATATGGNSILMDGGSITLASGVTLKAGTGGYKQTGGTFTASDTGDTLDVIGISSPTIQFNGGTLKMGTALTFGKLTTSGGDVSFNGVTYNAKIAGAGGSQDQLYVQDHKLTIQGTSSVTVTIFGTLVTGKTWDIIDVSNGTAIADFATKTLPGGVTLDLAQLNNGDYELDS
jgi:hypothetical protein